MGVLTTADGPALEMAACAYAEYRAAFAVLQKDGATYATTTPSGSILRRPQPEAAIAADAWRRYVSALDRFGLSPATRSKVSAAPRNSPREESYSVADSGNEYWLKLVSGGGVA